MSLMPVLHIHPCICAKTLAVYIPNFDPRCTEDQLCEVASKSGRVISTHLGKADAYNMEQATYGGTGAHRQ